MTQVAFPAARAASALALSLVAGACTYSFEYPCTAEDECPTDLLDAPRRSPELDAGIDGAPPPADAAVDAPTVPVNACPDALFCEDFEGALGAPWLDYITPGGSVTLSPDARLGNFAMKASLTDVAVARKWRIISPPITTGTLYVRMWQRVVAASPLLGTPIILSLQSSSNIEEFYLAQGNEGLNLIVSAVPDSESADQPMNNIDEWHCIEVEATLDTIENPDGTTTTTGSVQVSIDEIPAMVIGTEDPFPFTDIERILIGAAGYDQVDVYIDDVYVGTEAVGCEPTG
jgi:hypothetical protein